MDIFHFSLNMFGFQSPLLSSALSRLKSDIELCCHKCLQSYLLYTYSMND